MDSTKLSEVARSLVAFSPNEKSAINRLPWYLFGATLGYVLITMFISIASWRMELTYQTYVSIDPRVQNIVRVEHSTERYCWIFWLKKPGHHPLDRLHLDYSDVRIWEDVPVGRPSWYVISRRRYCDGNMQVGAWIDLHVSSLKEVVGDHQSLNCER